MNNTIQQRLQSYYESLYPMRQRLKVKNVVTMTAGLSHEMYGFDVDCALAPDTQCEAFVLRIYSGDGALESSAKEFAGMRRLRDAGYPVPNALTLEHSNSVVGRPFIIMEKIAGQVLWQRVVDAPEEKRAAIHALFCELLFRLHQIDWRQFVDAADALATTSPYAFADKHLTNVRISLEQHSLSGLFPIVDWLQKRRDDVPCHRPSVVHGDFHYQNVMLRDDGSPVVIDWTTLQVSDPRMDLAWTLLLQETFVSTTLRDYVLTEYERLAGTAIQHLEWFETLACLWRLRDVVVVLTKGADKIGMHSEAATMLQQQKGPIGMTYDILVENTAIRVPEVEDLLATL